MANPIMLPEGFPEDTTIIDYGFNRPMDLKRKKLLGVFLKESQLLAITVSTKGKYIVKAEKAIAQGLTEVAGPNKYYLKPGAVLKISKI